MSFVDALKKLGFEGEQKSLSLKEREIVYAAAYGMYQVGDYKNSASHFLQLILNEPYELRFWKGLASSRQMEGDYKAALHAWSIVCLLGGHSPISHFHAAECYLSLNEFKEAVKALECAQTHLKSETDPLAKRIAELKKVIADG